jgi:hypothetical protein
VQHRAIIAIGAAFVACFGTTAGAVTVVEYYDPQLDHYFITPLPSETDPLDSGRIAGWMRTGLAFDASASAAPGLSPVCRFYIPPEHGDSHFLSAFPDECAAVLARIGTDPNFSGYREETPAEFYIALPDRSSGACPAGTAPVYRLWNHRPDSNHRYTADRTTRDAMIARGYTPEGYGPDGVAMCTPRARLGDSQVRVTAQSPFAPGCDLAFASGIVYAGAEVEPQVAIDPRDPSHLIGVWQQDRWSDGGARGLRTGYSFDGGLTWSLTQAAFSRCTGGNAANGGDYARASDPWVSIGPDGIAYQVAIAFNGATFAPGSTSAVLVSRSIDGGRTWSAATTLIRDGAEPFNDKESIAADPLVGGHAYATWDRLEQTAHGPAWFSRTTDGGVSWEAARPVYETPGTASRSRARSTAAVRERRRRLVRAPRRRAVRFQYVACRRRGSLRGRLPGVASASGEFVALFARTNTDAANRTDVFASVFRSSATAAALQATAKSAYRAAGAAPLAMTAELQERVTRSIRRTLRGRLVGGVVGGQ